MEQWGRKDDMRMPDITFESTIICPHCAFAKQETMPDDG
jgi:hypothetical protein